MKKISALLLALVMISTLCACGSSSSGNSGDAAADPDSVVYHIGIIQQMEHEALDTATKGFEDALIELLGADHVEFDLQNAQGEAANCATIANSFVSEGVDLIMANATSSLQAAAAATANIPILGTSVTDYATALDIDDWTGVAGTNVSGTSDLAPLDEQANCIAELCPAAVYPNVGIVYCSAEANSIYQATVIRGCLEDLGYNVYEYAFADSNDIASVVTKACDACEVLYVPTDNTAASNNSIIDNIALPAGVPVFVGEESNMSGCGIATLSISYYDIGYITGQMAYDILVNGADVSTMEVRTAPNVTKEYVASRCEQLGITVPDDYVEYVEG